MKNPLGCAVALLAVVFASGCGPLGGGGGSEEGGANANDRSAGGNDGELLETGAMSISPSGAYVIAQRNTSTVIVDVKGSSYRELDFQGERFVFSRTREVAYVLLADRQGVIAMDLASGAELWRSVPAFTSTAGAFLARVTADDRTIVIADYDRVFFLDAKTGDVRTVATVGVLPMDLEIMADDKHALVVASTTWDDAGPHTPVSLVDLEKQTATSIDIPNCAAPISILPDGARALVSPTFCTRDQKTAPAGWRNPDPVSVIDIDTAAGTLKFVKNLPGFGPTALLGDGRAVAYLDMKRIDESMFDDKAQIPAAGSPQFHLMLIQPKTLKFELVPIGDKLPRFAPSKDGKSLLVDATVSVVRSEASASVTLDANGLKAEVKSASFGDDSGSLFGAFDLTGKKYVPFTGPAASLDRFVQLGDGSQVFTLRNNGRGGDLFSIDLAAKTTFDLGKSLRDVGVLPDGRTLVFRIRIEGTADGYLREEFCFTTDGRVCNSDRRSTSVQYKSPVPQHDP